MGFLLYSAGMNIKLLLILLICDLCPRFEGCFLRVCDEECQRTGNTISPKSLAKMFSPPPSISDGRGFIREMDPPAEEPTQQYTEYQSRVWGTEQYLDRRPRLPYMSIDSEESVDLDGETVEIATVAELYNSDKESSRENQKVFEMMRKLISVLKDEE